MAIAATDLRLVVVLLLLLRRLGLLLFLGVGLALLPFALLGKCIDKGAFLAVVKVLLAGGRSGGQGTGSVSRAQGSGARGQWRQSTLRRVKDVQRVVFRLPAHNGLFAAEALQVVGRVLRRKVDKASLGKLGRGRSEQAGSEHCRGDNLHPLRHGGRPWSTPGAWRP